jgi:FkbM family methyltransferase
MHILQKSLQDGLLHPMRGIGRAIARRWPVPVRVRLVNGRSMYVDLRSGIGRGLLMKGEFDPEVFAPIRAVLRKGGTFLDIGANVGFYSMLALDHVGAEGHIHAFEIDARPLRCLKLTVNENRLGNLHVWPIAVGEHDGYAHLNARSESGNSSVEMTGNGPAVPITSLDTWWSRSRATGIQAMKIDIEGGELWALRGARELLREERPLLVCEILHDVEERSGYRAQDILDLLDSYGYRVRFLEGVWSPTIVAEFKAELSHA